MYVCMYVCSHSVWNFDPTEINVKTSHEFTDKDVITWNYFLFIRRPFCTSYVSEKGPQVLLSWYKLA